MRLHCFGTALGSFCLLVATGCGKPARAPGAPDDPGNPPVFDAGTPEPADCRTSTMQDVDGDGFSRSRGDCDDCAFGLGPAALDVPGNGIDEDCDGTDLATAPQACDAKLEAESVLAEEAARALGICQEHNRLSRLPGLIEASWGRLSGSKELGDERQVWLPTKFGTIGPREGTRSLVLSTGIARDVNDEEYTKGCDTLGLELAMDGSGWSSPQQPPEGYPRDSSQCKEGVGSEHAPAYNDVALELTLRVPSNANSFSFDSIFFTYEYPDFVCSQFNDFFLVLVDPAPKDLDDGNVLFDVNEDTIGVNTGLLAVCREAERGRVPRPVTCERGPALLAETGYDEGESTCAAEVTTKRDIGGASTGWLHTSVPVSPGKVITIRFVLWDSGDPLLDSSVIIDNFQWSLDMPKLGTTPITAG